MKKTKTLKRDTNILERDTQLWTSEMGTHPYGLKEPDK